MTSLQVIILIVFSICALLWVLFRVKNKRDSLLFADKIHALHTEMETHSEQLDRRSNALNRYDFLRYNLGEALEIQLQIKL